MFSLKSQNKVVDATQPGTPLLTMSDLDTNNDGNPLASEYQNLAMNAHLEFRPNQATLPYCLGDILMQEVYLFKIRIFYNQGLDYWAQARMTTGNFFPGRIQCE